MNDFNDANYGSGCEGSDCGCNPSNSGNDNGKGWKIFIFTAVLLLAVGVTAYSLIYKSKPAANPGSCAAGSVCGIGGTCVIPCDAGAPVTAIDKKLTDADFLIVLFLQTDLKATSDISQALEKISAKIKTMGKKPEILTLNPGDQGYDEAIAKYCIKSLPAVLALGEKGGTVLAWDEITEGRLMLEYYRNCPNSPSGSSQSN